jgi:hypothetical protein
MTSRAKLLMVLSLATLCTPALGANGAHPETIDYIEGSALLAREPVTQKSVGTVALDPGQVLSTQQGKAEVLLTPGIYLRLDDDSSVKMISPNLTFTQLALEKGRATVEIDEIHPQNHVQIIDGGVPTQLLKAGLYEFNANNDTASVFNGKAAAYEASNKSVVIKEDHQLALNEGPAKSRSISIRTPAKTNSITGAACAPNTSPSPTPSSPDTTLPRATRPDGTGTPGSMTTPSYARTPSTARSAGASTPSATTEATAATTAEAPTDTATTVAVAAAAASTVEAASEVVSTLAAEAATAKLRHTHQASV